MLDSFKTRSWRAFSRGGNAVVLGRVDELSIVILWKGVCRFAFAWINLPYKL